MREIKFRAWDNETNEMLDMVTVACERKDPWPPLYTKDGIINGIDHQDYVLMQYTGLRDKNGKEVYQGDIVRCSRGCPHEVIWLEEYGGTYVGGMPTWYLSGISEGYAWTGEEEIIGNIYENPELLEVSK